MYDYFWLRDNARDSQSFNAESHQREVFTAGIDPVSNPLQVEVIEQGRAVSVVWPDVGSAIRYESAFLHSYQKPLVESVYASAKTWNAKQFKLDPPLNFHGIESEAETRELARRLQQTGFCLIEGCPPQTESVNKVANTMGYVRETIFGGVW